MTPLKILIMIILSPVALVAILFSLFIAGVIIFILALVLFCLLAALWYGISTAWDWLKDHFLKGVKRNVL